MKIAEAIAFIEPGFKNEFPNHRWADLGCGSGTFTKALASLLGNSSKIYAVDKESQRIKSDEASMATIEFVKLDFIRDTLPFSDVDGILMANALHYVKDKPAFIEKLRNLLTADGQLVIVEYDTEIRNPWIPYPISFDNLTKTFPSYGFRRIQKIGERSSIYRADKMYACLIDRD